MKQQLINAPKHLIPPFLLTTEHSTPRKGIFTCRERRKTADNFVARELDIEQISLLLAGEEYFGLYQVQKDNDPSSSEGIVKRPEREESSTKPGGLARLKNATHRHIVHTRHL
ncbi:hypothetical protein CDAR_481971 [Caerostris darwini]|uniref:Uncharacterized protein n=1 Tax=Caerostris darwini TaxID=1538125 RepID=A0AAV4THU9_9ARAC|nr:hypothetical protein CDAR_481971 [Caerostris darwini]